MRSWAAWVTRRSSAAIVVLLVLVVGALGGFFASRAEQDDNVFAFLPKDAVDTFQTVAGRYGSLRVGLVGVEGDVFEGDFLDRLGKITKDLNTTDGVSFALSLTSVEDPVEDKEKGGVVVRYLVDHPPATPEERAALRERVLSRDAVVGNLVSLDGKAVLIYCFLAEGDTKAATAEIRKRVTEGFPSQKVVFGGAPFVSSYVLDVTQADVKKLGPIAGIVILVLTFVFLRSALGTFLAIAATGLAITMTMGGLQLAGQRPNLVVASAPIVLLALGTGLSLAFLPATRAPATPEAALRQRGGTVLAAGIAAAAGAFSCAAMDLAPMRLFGYVTAAGVLLATLVGLSFVPAALALANRPGAAGGDRFGTWLAARAKGLAAQRSLVAAALLALAIGGGVLARKVDTGVDSEALFAAESPPAQAERFLREKFGGSQFVMIDIAADLQDPAVLREIQFAADRIERIEHVSNVQHIVTVLTKINLAMSGEELVPDTREKAGVLYGFLQGKAAARQLADDDRGHAVLQVKLDVDRAAELAPVLAEVERAAKEIALDKPTRVAPGDPSFAEKGKMAERRTARIEAILRRNQRKDAAGIAKTIVAALGEPAGAGAGATAAVAAYLGSDECLAELPDVEGLRDKAAAALAALDPSAPNLRDAITAALEGVLPDDAKSTAAANAKPLERPLREILVRSRAAAHVSAALEKASIQGPSDRNTPEGRAHDRLVASLTNALLDTEPAPVLAAGAPPNTNAAVKFDLTVTGQPVLNRMLEASVAKNQIRSALVAVGLALIAAFAFLRRAGRALLAMVPVLVSLAVVYGAMGALHVRLDLGTSMLASLTVGSAIAFSISLIGAMSDPSEGDLTGVKRFGPALAGSSLAVAAGFGVLAMGQAKPLQSLGAMTALAMLAAGATTLFGVAPLFVRAGSKPVRNDRRTSKPRDQ